MASRCIQVLRLEADVSRTTWGPSVLHLVRAALRRGCDWRGRRVVRHIFVEDVLALELGVVLDAVVAVYVRIKVLLQQEMPRVVARRVWLL